MLTLQRKTRLWIAILVTPVAWTACSTTEVAPDTSVMPVVPDYVKVPHPQGYEIAEIRALFENPLAPKGGLGAFTDTCDGEFRMLTRATQIKEERQQGAGELVAMSAEKMHWCFYGKVERMQQALKTEESWTARQKIVLDAYEFLSPIAAAFLNIYHDSRYLRWATQYYSNISESIFFRKVVPGPENTLALTTGATTDLETWTTRQKESKKLSVFARYGIEVKHAEDEAAPAPAAAAPVAQTPQLPPIEELGRVPAQSSAPAAAAPAAPTSEASSDLDAPVDALQTKPGFTGQLPDEPLTPIKERNPATAGAPASAPAAAPAQAPAATKVPAPKKVQTEPETGDFAL